MVRVEVENIVLNISTSAPIVVLKDSDRQRILPIVIGLFEAQAILLVLEKTEFTRPLTHDLMRNVLKKIEGSVTKLEIHSLKENTYYADLVLEVKGATVRVDCRPSDGIALALRTDSPIFVADDLLEKPDVIRYYDGENFAKSNDFDRPIEQNEAESFRKYIEELNGKEFWKKLKE